MLKYVFLLVCSKLSFANEPYFEHDERIQLQFLMWPQTQVYIYENINFFEPNSSKMPDCFGTLISFEHVLTAASCVNIPDHYPNRNLSEFLVAKVKNL